MKKEWLIHRHITHPYPFEASEENLALKLVFRWRTSRFGALVVTSRSITTRAHILLPAAVVHVEQQCYNINDVNVKEHHYDHEVGAGTHAALVGREALARLLLERQGRAPGRCRVLSVWGVLVVTHYPERCNKELSLSSAPSGLIKQDARLLDAH